MARTPIDILREKRARVARRRPDVPARRRQGEPYLARIVNQWWTRLLESVYQGSLSEQEERYYTYIY